MTIHEALAILGIEDYADRIINSNSHGELIHLRQYIELAETLNDDEGLLSLWFRPWFEEAVKLAEQNWERPESVFQHIPTILKGHMRASLHSE